jgi:hypothetical protein
MFIDFATIPEPWALILAHAKMPRLFWLRHFHIDSLLFSLDNVGSEKT